MVEISKINDNIYEVPIGYRPGMRVPGRIFVSAALREMVEPGTIDQVANVANLPGIVKYSMAMPDAHLGYGFPIGGVAAFREEDGIISPGGVGFDINCGVRLLRTDLQATAVQPRINTLIDALFEAIPSGLGATGRLHASDQQLTEVFINGSKWAVEEGYGFEADLSHCEESGHMPGADPAQVSVKARKRGRPQLGTLGSGNHFLEIQRVEEIYDEPVAKKFGLFKGQITVMIHCGSRGAGHQICTDHLEVLSRAVKKYNIDIPDKQLACAPLGSPEADNYFGAMVCAANYAWANRHIIAHWTREVFERYFPGCKARSGLRRGPQRGQDRGARGGRQARTALCAPQRGHAGLRPQPKRGAAGLRGRGPASAHTGQHGNVFLRPLRQRRGPGPHLRLRLPRRGQGHEPQPGPQDCSPARM